MNSKDGFDADNEDEGDEGDFQSDGDESDGDAAMYEPMFGQQDMLTSLLKPSKHGFHMVKDSCPSQHMVVRSCQAKPYSQGSAHGSVIRFERSDYIRRSELR